MRPLYVAERDLDKVETDLREGQLSNQPAATSSSLPPRSRGNTPLISLVMKLFPYQVMKLFPYRFPLWFSGKSRHRVGVYKDEHDSIITPTETQTQKSLDYDVNGLNTVLLRLYLKHNCR